MCTRWVCISYPVVRNCALNGVGYLEQGWGMIKWSVFLMNYTCRGHDHAIGIVLVLGVLLSKLGLPHLRVEVLAAADDRDDVISLELVLQALLDLPQELDPVLHELEDDVLVRRRRVLVLREEVLTTDDLYGSMGGRKREGGG